MFLALELLSFTILFKLESRKLSGWEQHPCCWWIRLCIWMPSHRPDEISCCVSIIITDNDGILKSCNTYSTFYILWEKKSKINKCFVLSSLRNSLILLPGSEFPTYIIFFLSKELLLIFLVTVLLASNSLHFGLSEKVYLSFTFEGQFYRVQKSMLMGFFSLNTLNICSQHSILFFLAWFPRSWMQFSFLLLYK